MHNYIRLNCHLCRDTSFCQIKSVLETAECVAVSQDTLFWQTYMSPRKDACTVLAKDTLFCQTRTSALM